MTQQVNISQRLDLLAQTRDQLRELHRDLEAQAKVVKSQLDANEIELIAALDELGVNKFSVGKLSFSVSENRVGTVDDWDQVYAYIREHNAFHLLHRRLSNGAYVELFDLGQAPGGIVPGVKRTLNFRKSAG